MFRLLWKISLFIKGEPNKKFIPYNKLSKKEQHRIDWGGLDPVTRVVPDKAKYSRKEKHRTNYEEDI